MNDLPLPEFLLRWLSVDVESLEGGTAHLRFARFPEGEFGLLAVLAIAGLFAVVGLLYAREGRTPTFRKIVMGGLRCLVVLVTAAVVFYPVLEVNRTRDLRATTIVLLDDSASMGIRDRYRGAPVHLEAVSRLLAVDPAEVRETSRAGIVTRAVRAGDSRVLRELREENLLQVYTFSDQLRTVSAPVEATETGHAGDGDGDGDGDGGEPGGVPDTPAPPPVPLVEIEPRGHVTDLAGALRTAVEQQGGGRVAAAVVLTDGRLTAGEGVQGVAQFLRQKGIPVHALGVGDPTPPRNFRITAVVANERVFSGDPINLEVRVRQRGYEGDTVTVELLDEFQADRAGEPARRSLGVADLGFAEGQSEGSAPFRVELEGIGRHRLTARIEPRPEEAFSDDNARTETVEVVEEASRALLIAGAPAWEYRYLKNLMRRDRRVFLAAWLMSADPDYPQEGNTSLKRLPSDVKELFEYDVVLLLDVDPAGLPPGFPELLERFVGKHRGGLLYVAGETYATRFFRSQAMQPIVDMLPVVPDISRAESEAGSSPFHETGWPIVPTRVASTHAATRLSSRPERNRRRWEELPGAYWSFPVRKPKPGATVLLTHADPRRRVAGADQPILAWQYYEGGRVIFLGIDATWRWRSTTAEVYDQFWIQTVRYLTETRLMGGRRQLLQTESETVDLGDIVRISALLLDEAYKPLEIESQTVTIEHPGGDVSEMELERDATAAGWYRGVFVPRALGEHYLRLPDGTETLVRVEPPDLEFREPRLDEATLRELAARTGGSYAPIWEIASVPAKIPDRRRTVVTTDEPIPLWDNWFVLGLLAGLLSLEWILRKWNRLL